MTSSHNTPISALKLFTRFAAKIEIPIPQKTRSCINIDLKPKTPALQRAGGDDSLWMEIVKSYRKFFHAIGE